MRTCIDLLDQVYLYYFIRLNAETYIYFAYEAGASKEYRINGIYDNGMPSKRLRLKPLKKPWALLKANLEQSRGIS